MRGKISILSNNQNHKLSGDKINNTDIRPNLNSNIIIFKIIKDLNK